MRFERILGGVLRVLRGREAILWLLLALLVLCSIPGLVRLRVHDDFLRFFRADLPAYSEYVSVARAFESDDADLIVLVEAEDLAAPEVVTALSDLLLDAQFIPGIRGVVSPFSVRLQGPDGLEQPLFPYPALPRAEMARRLDRARADSPALQHLMSADRGAMIAVLPMTEQGENVGRDRRAQVAAVEALADRAMAASGATIRLTGYPVLRDTVMQALVNDMILLQAVGLIVGLLVSTLALRSLRLALLTLPGPTMGVFVCLALHGAFGIAINTVTVVLPVLVLVLGASDSIHIMFERGRQGGRDSLHATLRAVRRVAVACIFAAVTTAMAFAALATSRSELISEMGFIGAIVTLASVVTVLLVQTIVLTLAGRTGWGRRQFEALHAHPPTGFGISRLPRLALARPRLVAWASLAVVAVTTLLYAQAGPRYSLMDSLYEDSALRQSFETVEARVMPISRIEVPVRSTDPQVIARVHEVVAGASGSDKVQSAASLAPHVGADMPELLARRLVSDDGGTALVVLPFRYVNGAQTMALAETISRALEDSAALEGVTVGPVTGLPVMSARVAGVVLDDINRSLLIALAGVALLNLLWLRNLRVALLALLPNMLPVTVIGAWVMLSGRGIEFSNALALTVAFGIAVDDTLHALNRLRLTGGVTRLSRRRLYDAFDEVAPALVTTSLVLVFGVGGTFFAENKAVGDFGKIAMAVYALALVADLFVLPALLAAFGPQASREKWRKPG